MQVRTYRRCPLCTSVPASDLHGLSGYWYCRRCQLSWAKKFPVSEYDENYYSAKSSLIGKAFAPIANILYVIRTWYVRMKRINLWIDVGAGDGGFLRNVVAKRKIGVEVSPSGRSMMETAGIETMTDQEFLRKKNLRADVISFWHVLEHIENPWVYVGAAVRNLGPHGSVVIGVPNGESLELQLFKRHWFHLVPKHHLWFFSPRSLEIMLAQHRLFIKSIDYWSIEHHFPGILQSLINVTSGGDSVLHRLVKRRENFSVLTGRDVVSSLFWLTLGFPLVLVLWITNSLFKRSGTIVIVAQKQKV